MLSLLLCHLNINAGHNSLRKYLWYCRCNTTMYYLIRRSRESTGARSKYKTQPWQPLSYTQFPQNDTGQSWNESASWPPAIYIARACYTLIVKVIGWPGRRRIIDAIACHNSMHSHTKICIKCRCLALRFILIYTNLNLKTKVGSLI